MPGGFPYAPTEAHRTPTEPRKAAWVRDTTKHANAPQRAAEGAQSHARKNDRETHPEQHHRPNGSLFVHFSFCFGGS